MISRHRVQFRLRIAFLILAFSAAAQAQPACQEDLDGDGVVGTGDLIILLGAWGTDPGGAPDFDLNGNVGTEDLIQLLGAWGPCPDTVAIQGTLESFWWIFEGQIDAVDLCLDGKIVNTGRITYSLDLSDPESQTNSFDFDNMTTEYHADILLSAPLLKELGQPPQSIHVDFFGTIDSLCPTEYVPGVKTGLVIETSLTGGGTFGPDQLFEGWTYGNIQINNNKIIIEGNNRGDIEQVPENRTNVDGEVDANLESPDGLQKIPLQGSGTGLINPTPSR